MGEGREQERRPVIDPEYCEHDGVGLAVVRKVLPKTDSSIIVADSDNNRILFRINPIPTIFNFNKKRVLADADGNVILTFRNKSWSLHGRWSVHRGESKRSNDLIFTAKLGSIFSWKSRLKVFLPKNTKEEVCDFKVASKTRDKFFAGNDDNNVIAEADEYKVKVNGGVDYAFVVSLIAILDGMNELRNEQRAGRGSALGNGLNIFAAIGG